MLAAMILGAAITAGPPLLALIPAQSNWMQQVQENSQYLLVPGAAVGIVLAMGRAHDVSFAVVLIGNAVVYTGVLYLVLLLWRKGAK